MICCNTLSILIPIISTSCSIIPIPKKGKTDSLDDYRPITLLNIMSKIFEFIIFQCLTNFVYENGIVNDQQYGFCKNSSCVHNLLMFNNYVNQAFDEKHDVHCFL